jgi:phosphatidylserine/phosphatidylglycerophosphate/cardiolipin synthase-like enzyme
MKSKIGDVVAISTSGKKWNDGRAGDIRGMFNNTLQEAKDRVQISTFTLGYDNDEVNEFFEIIKELVKSERKVQLIVNDDNENRKKKNPSCSNYAKKEISKLQRKIVVVDSKTALVGSANISRHALSLNHEIMLKISGDVAGDLSLLFDELSKTLRDEADG